MSKDSWKIIENILRDTVAVIVFVGALLILIYGFIAPVLK